jgi:hypothetical protein
MRKSIIGGLAVLAVVVAACQPTKPPPPPPGENPDRDVLLLGDSVGFGVGCMLGHNGGDAGQNCPPKPGFSTWNGYLGACAVAEGLIQLYGTNPQGQFTAVQGNCNAHTAAPDTHYASLWPALVDAVTPDLVVIVTGGWEIVNRWNENAFPSGGLCTPTSIFTCAAPHYQMGNPANGGTLITAAKDNYKANLQNAINLIRSRPSNPKVLVLNSPYVAPETPDPSNVWYEAYPEDEPDNWASSNTNTPYASSEVKVDNFNDAVAEVVEGFNDPDNIDWFDFWLEFSPVINGDEEFSFDLCPFPDNKNDPSTCPGEAFTARLSDAGHLTTAGNNLLGEYLLDVVAAMLA